MFHLDGMVSTWGCGHYLPEDLLTGVYSIERQLRPRLAMSVVRSESAWRRQSDASARGSPLLGCPAMGRTSLRWGTIPDLSRLSCLAL